MYVFEYYYAKVANESGFMAIFRTNKYIVHSEL